MRTTIPERLRPWSSSAARSTASLTSPGIRTFSIASLSMTLIVLQKASWCNRPVSEGDDSPGRQLPAGETPDHLRLEAEESADPERRQQARLRLLVDPGAACLEVAGHILSGP